MTTFDSPPPLATRIEIDGGFLLRHITPLNQIKRKHCTWDQCGGKIISNLPTSGPRFRTDNEPVESGTSTNSPDWQHAKALIHDSLVSKDPKYNAIRKRLGDLQSPSTRRLLSTLSLWLAGQLGKSVSVTTPMVGIMLYAISEAGGDASVLLDFTSP